MAKNEHEEVGGLAGLGAGVLAGAAAGTAVMPIVGTFTGALVGGLVGSELGKTVGGALLDAFDVPPADAPQPHGPAQAGGPEVLEQLERLARMKEQGLINEEEFQAAKARLLGL